MSVALRPDDFTVLSLCSGGGGLDLGLGLAVRNARTVCYVEREAFAAARLVEAMGEGLVDDAPIWSDLATFDGVPWRGVVDCIVPGWPCPPYSVAGRRRGAGDARDLWPDVFRILEEVRPRLFFGENVAGFAGARMPDGLARSLRDLTRLGYRTAATLVTAAEVGASHERERCFLLADTRRGMPERRRGPGGGGRAPGAAEGAARERERRRPAAGLEGDGLADAPDNQRRRGERRAEAGTPPGGERRGRSTGASADVADAARARRPGREREAGRRGRGRVREASDAMADADRRGLGIERQSEPPRSGEHPEPRLAGAHGDMDDADRAGRGRGRVPVRQSRQDEAAPEPSGAIPLFPPGPGATDVWRRILEFDPSLAPALEPPFRELPDGVAADRRHWLRLLGNGVVPLQAAYAFCALAASQGLALTGVVSRCKFHSTPISEGSV